MTLSTTAIILLTWPVSSLITYILINLVFHEKRGEAVSGDEAILVVLGHLGLVVMCIFTPLVLLMDLHNYFEKRKKAIKTVKVKRSMLDDYNEFLAEPIDKRMKQG